MVYNYSNPTATKLKPSPATILIAETKTGQGAWCVVQLHIRSDFKEKLKRSEAVNKQMGSRETSHINGDHCTSDSVSRTYSGSYLNGGSHLTANIQLPVGNIAEHRAELNHNVSIARTSSTTGASLRRLFSMSSSSHPQLDEDLENLIVSQAGDVGDNVVRRRRSGRESARFSIEQGVVYPIPEELLESYGFWSRDNLNDNVAPSISPLVTDFVTPPSTNAVLHKEQEEKKELPHFVEYCAYLVHLAVFGIFGVLNRYLLQKLFSSTLHVTRDGSIAYLDLPSNMVGSFLMGWFGVVFKPNISHMSDHLAVGLSTGFLGSLTTFSGWNQKMLELSVDGHWVFAVLGFAIGLLFAASSITFGIETAKGFRGLLRTRRCTSFSKLRVSSIKSHTIVLSVLVLVWAGLWTTSGILEKREFKNGGSVAQLWLGCLVGPMGVWIRWWLAKLNGRGLGKAERWNWLPFGTLAANVSAACVMAALATVKKAVNTKDCETIVAGIQFGLMGCLSTVSTFIAEFNAMRKSSHPWRAYAYALTTILISFASGTLIFSVPVWTWGTIRSG